MWSVAARPNAFLKACCLHQRFDGAPCVGHLTKARGVVASMHQCQRRPTMPIMAHLETSKVTHINQVLVDFDEANAHYERCFGALEYMNSYEETQDRDASLFLIGETCVELFRPRGPESLLGQNHARFGDSWHSFEIKVDDLEAAKAVFEERGVRITTYWPDSFFMVHPKDAHGLLFEVCCLEMENDPRLEPNWTASPWEEGPLGIVGLRALTAVVRDLEATTVFLSDLLGQEPQGSAHHPGIARTATFLLGDTSLEIQEPDGTEGPVAAYLERWGPRMRSLDFLSSDVDAAAAHLEGLGLAMIDGDLPGWRGVDPANNFGVLYQLCPLTP